MRSPDAGAMPNILVVEDEALIALLVQDVLAADGYETEWVTAGSFAAPDAAHRAQADGAVVDIRLGDGLDGRDVVRRLRRTRPALPVVFFTGYNAAAPQADLRGLGGPTVRLHKPNDLDDIPQRLAEILGGAAPRPKQQRRGTDRPVPGRASA